jgi:hypothetical protein
MRFQYFTLLLLMGLHQGTTLADDGADGKNTSTHTIKVRPTVPSRLNSKVTLKEKISDCAQEDKNGEKALWNGTPNS